MTIPIFVAFALLVTASALIYQLEVLATLKKNGRNAVRQYSARGQKLQLDEYREICLANNRPIHFLTFFKLAQAAGAALIICYLVLTVQAALKNR